MKQADYTEQIQDANATMYADQHGIVNYKRNGWIMTYNVSYPAYLNNPRYTVQHKVDLKSGREIETRVLKRYDPKGEVNR